MESLDIVSQVVSEDTIQSNKVIEFFCSLCDIFVDQAYFTSLYQDDVEIEARVNQSNQLILTVICPGLELTEDQQTSEVISAFNLMMLCSEQVTINAEESEKLRICFVLPSN